MPSALPDVKYAIRGMRKKPGFAAVVVAVLALGIGANTAIFTVVDAVLLRPLPFTEPERLMELSETYRSQLGAPISWPNYVDWEKQQTVFESLTITAPFPRTLSGGQYPERVIVTTVSHQFLRVYRTRPILGRHFMAEDDRETAVPVALLSHGTWTARYGADPNIVGRKVVLDEKPHTVVGVLPPFPFYRGGDYFVPIATSLEKYNFKMRENHNNTSATGRLKPGVTLEQARAQMSTIAARLAQAHPHANTNRGIAVVPLQEWIGGSMKDSVLMLLGAVGLVLLVACANVANLLLARASVREKEIAIRASIGASRWDILRQLLIESLLLAVTGAAAGLLVAKVSLRALLAIFPGAEHLGGIVLDARVLAFAIAAALLTGLLFGMAPALHLARLELAEAMKSGGRSGGHAARMRVRKALVVTEVALALVLLVGAGLLLRSFASLLQVHPGFRPEHVLTANVSVPSVDGAEISGIPREYERLLERVRQLPGVQSAGLVNFLPLAGQSSSMVFYRADRPAPPKGQYPAVLQRIASPGYFEAMGIPLVRGRLFTADDGRLRPLHNRMDEILAWWRSTEFRVVINRTMAERIWPGEDPVGKRFRGGYVEMNGPHMVVVGVVGDTRHRNLATAPEPEFYSSSYLFPSNRFTLTIRASEDPTALASSLRAITAASMPSAVLEQVRTMEDVIEGSVSSRRNNVLLLAIFSGLALLLAAVGTYAVLAYLVSQRSHEIGVRVALGAERGHVVGLVMREAVLLGGLGLLAGIAASTALTRLISSMLYGVTAADPLTYAAVVAVLGLVTLAAAWLPARRAAHVDPLVALRCE